MKRIFNARSLSLLLILILLLANRLYSHRNITRLSDDIGKVAHTHHVLDLTSEVMRVVVDAETGCAAFCFREKTNFCSRIRMPSLARKACSLRCGTKLGITRRSNYRLSGSQA